MSSNSRDRILDAGWALMHEQGANTVTLADVAGAAGVSRQAVYMHFKNRAGLLTAMARRHDIASGFDDEMTAAAALAPVEAFERMLRLWCAYIPKILPFALALEAASVTGEEGAEAWQDRMRDLRGAFRYALRGIEGVGRLADSWTVQEATDWTYARTHLKTYDALVTERGWSQSAFAERTVASLRRELIKSDSAGRL